MGSPLIAPVAAFASLLLAVPAASFHAVTLKPRTVAAAALGGTSCQVFPSNNVWNADISRLPVNARSAAWLASSGAGAGKLIHPDFGGPPYGIPLNIVHSSHATTMFNFEYWDDSDPAVATRQPQGPYPYGSDLVREGRPTAT